MWFLKFSFKSLSKHYTPLGRSQDIFFLSRARLTGSYNDILVFDIKSFQSIDKGKK